MNKSDLTFHINPQLKVANFKTMIRKKLVLKPDQSIDILSGKYILSPTKDMGEIYTVYSDPDGFLYISYIEDSPF